jgi:hypothetical protein
VWNVLKTTTPSSISEVMQYYWLIILKTCASSNFKTVWCRYPDPVLFSECGVVIIGKKIHSKLIAVE